MDLIPDKTTLALWLQHYGSFALFGLMALGIVALPVPDETLMVIAGILMYKNKLDPISTIVAAYCGSIVGITVSYWLGRTAGKYILARYGSFFGLTELKMDEVRQWYKRMGKWSLFFGYFIPGIRHFTGFFAGMAKLPFTIFALFAYMGAVLWVSTFLAVGYYIHHYWTQIVVNIEEGVETFIFTLLFLWMCHCYYKTRKSQL
jgi:membrane protein DedA with SNARE-associated domain